MYAAARNLRGGGYLLEVLFSEAKESSSTS